MSAVGKPDRDRPTIGIIPSSWAVKKLDALADIDSESLSGNTAADFSFRYISLSDVKNGELIKTPTILFSEAPSRARRIVKSGDVLFSTVRPNLKGHGFARHVQESIVASTGFAVIRAKKELIAPSFLYHYLLSASIDDQIEKLTVGSNYPAVNSSDVKNLSIVVPSLPEQQKIAAILTTVDETLDVIARQIVVTQTLKTGLMQELFSRGVGTQDAAGRWVSHSEFKDSELGKIAAQWSATKLDVHAIKVGSGVTPKGGSESYLSNGVPLIRSQNVLVGRLTLNDVAFISAEQHKKMHNSALMPKDVLLNITGASIGRCAILPADFGEGNVNQHVCIIRTLPTLDPYFLCHYLNSSAGQKQVEKFQAGGNREGLNYQQIRSFDLPVPSLIEQQKIVEIFDGVDSKLDALAAKQAQYRNLKRGLMQKLLTGEWRVKLDTPVEEAIADAA